MSADPDRGILEPERASVEPIGSVEPAARSSATRRSARPIEASSARTAVLRQGLPRTGAYRASAVTRSMHPTPVAIPIVATTGIEAPPADRIAEIATPPSALGSAVISMRRDAAESMGAAVADPAVAVAELPGAIPASVETPIAPPALASVTSAPAAEAAAMRAADAGTSARTVGHRALRIGLGLLGAAVLGGVILLSALGSSRTDARPGSRSALPAAADLVHAVSDPAPPAIEVASPHAVAPPHATSAAPPPPVTPSPAANREEPPAAAPPAKPATSIAAEVAPAAAKSAPAAGAAPARPESSTARSGATGDPSPARPGASREPARARPASPPRPAPARPLTYDPDALFLPKQ